MAHGYDPLPRFDEPGLGRRARPDLADEYPLVLISAKVRSFSHSQHRGLPSLRKRDPEPYGELHPETAAAHGIVDGEPMAIATWPGRDPRSGAADPEYPARRRRHADRLVGALRRARTARPRSPTDRRANFGLIVGYDLKDELSGSIPGKSYRCRARPLAVAAARPGARSAALGG